MTRTVAIAPSILAADLARLGDEVAAIEAGGADLIHIDVMDGHFVPNISFGPGLVAALRTRTKLPLDVHLMIAPVDPHLPAFMDAGADLISVHPESGPHVHRTLQAIKARGVRAGLALNPGTHASAVAPVADLLDFVLVMSVNPGFGGQTFLPSQLDKIRAVRAALDDANRPDVRIEVDGGVSCATIAEAAAAGAEIFVAGTAVFGAETPETYGSRIADLRRAGAAAYNRAA